MPRDRRTGSPGANGWLVATAMLVVLGLPSAARPDITTFEPWVTPTDVQYYAVSDTSGTYDIYFNPSTPPTKGSTGDQRAAAVAGVLTEFTWANVPNGIYYSYLQLRTNPNDPNEVGFISGPLEVRVGPDLVFCEDDWGKAVRHTINTNSIRWKARVCNVGARVAGPFRVGFWWNQATAPVAGAREDQFVSVDGLAPIWTINSWPPCYDNGSLWGFLASHYLCVDRGQNPACCPEVTIDTGPLANGVYKQWAMVDSADFQPETLETNNLAGPYSIDLSLADLDVTGFSATVDSGGTVRYNVRVCNVGTKAATQFWVDVYPDRKLPPQPGYPGELITGVPSLAAGECLDMTFARPHAPEGVLQSWVLADADDFIKEPDELNNRKGPLEVSVRRAEGCVDADGDGYGVGKGCDGPEDCDDTNPEIHPKAVEVCGDGIDNNCNLTIDDGCPGVDCADADGDGWPVGTACVIQDCDDGDPEVYPHAKEVCGDGKDNNCNGIVDDGCPGRACVDRDEDGYGVGEGCPGPQDCDDDDPDTHPGATESCGDNQDNNCNGVVDDTCAGCVDNDGDGYGVGDGCGPLLQRDCDDDDPLTYPGAEELCDGKDHNCNYSIDDGCKGVDCVDEDGDGWPTGSECNPDYRDPDDGDPTVYPGATEICGDGKDNNANGTIDDGCPGVDCVDLDGDNWPTGPDCNQDFVDCDDTDVSVHPKRIGGEICGDGVDNTCSGTPDEGCRTCEDRDGDGYKSGPDCPITTPQDCDDEDSSIFPGAAERAADGQDVNCDAVVSDLEAKPSGCDCGGGAGGAPDAGGDRVLLVGLLLVGAWGRGRRRPGNKA
ncbi:MAG: hypothetical protein HY906_19040 [Deltaproteobacteria bacterium]|nr:hypothetical protein [Deltaproteobacteria bacterium]